MKLKTYIENSGKAVKPNKKFKHMMAISLDPKSNYKKGVIRCITSRKGKVDVKGYIDRSKLYKLEGKSLKKFEIKEELKIKNQEKIIKKIEGKEWEFIGLEDPDIWIDEKTNLTHLYFTIAFLSKREKSMLVCLGHAVGKNLDSLKMTMPSIMTKKNISAKELSIAPINKKGFRYNLIESSKKEKGVTYSVVKLAIAKDMNGIWKMGKIVFHPKKHKIPWIGEHASPGPLFPKTFLDIGENKMLGIMNGRESSKKIGNIIKYKMFSVGLFIYDYEKGKIDWVSKKSFIRDSKAKTITFASEFVETNPGKGILYAHVDDSFVRSYELNANSIKKLIPKKFKK